MKRHICSLLVLFTVAINMTAQHRDSISVCQFVKDSFTGYGIRNAFVTVMDTTGTVIDTLHTMPGNGSHDAQMWLLTVPRQMTSTVSTSTMVAFCKPIFHGRCICQPT